VQVRSFDAMCHMIAAGLGIGVAPRAACVSQIKTLGLKAVSLRDAWATRQLLVAHSAKRELPAAARLLLDQLTPAKKRNQA
jgi:DNA-binding transcriptional LysR family regulator